MTADRGEVVLGLSAGFHDAAAALVVGGRIVAAVEEERLSRVKHDASFPARAADTCLAIAGLDATAVDVVAFHEKPLGVLGRHLASRVRSGPATAGRMLLGTPDVAAQQLGLGRRLTRWFADRGAPVPAVALAEHHVSHAAAAFYPSPFREAAVLTVDGVGEWATSAIGRGQDHRLHLDCEMRYPDSVGLLYSAFTAYCGFRVNGGEGELMGLAPFGEPRYADDIRRHLVQVHDDGSVHLDRRHFAHVRGRRTTTRRFHDLFGGPPRPLGAAPTRREADLAASVQIVTEEILLAMAARAREITGLDRLCLAGGVALNCVANGRLAREAPFAEVWVQPAAGDAGNAVGAALWAWHEVLGHERPAPDDDAMQGAFLGPEFGDGEIGAWLGAEGIAHDAPADLPGAVAARLEAGAVVGWFQGRMEFGPRALGHRSILADARSATVQARINGLVKERAGFRPFAPAVLEDHVDEWFAHHGPAPYMTFAVPVADDRLVAAPVGAGDDPSDDLEAQVAAIRSQIPAVTHVDRSARIQTVDRVRNPELAGLIDAFAARTGCPVLLNTSFNARDEPIVCTPEDAYRTFRRTGLDLLVVGPYVVEP